MTPSRTQINQANAQHSTGPKTEAGKKKSSLNALRHGLTGQLAVMPSEDLAAYQRHLRAFASEYHPVGATEAQLVQALADSSWRLNRVAALETNLLSLGNIDAAALERQSKALCSLSLHSQRLSRQFERTVTQLRELQKTRQAQQQDKAKTPDHATAGFVFSEPQINTLTPAAQPLEYHQTAP